MTIPLFMRMSSRRNWMGNRPGIEWTDSGGCIGAIKGLVN